MGVDHHWASRRPGCCLSVMLLVAYVACLGLLPWQQHVREHMRRPFVHGPSLRPNTSDVSVLLVRQPLDHFDASERRTWTQRVFVRSTFFSGSGPVFVCVGGEGPALDATVLVASPHCNDAVELAPSVGALLIAVEHRFFGPSADVRPLPSFDTASLRFLSSSQAVEDLIGVHEHISALFGLKPHNRWVSFGGSYPGMVAGFARLKLPNLIHAAVSSSAPWRAVVDMPQYNDVVAAALANPSVGGSAECAAAVRDGHALLLRQLDSASGRRELEVLFSFCEKGLLERRDLALAWAGGGVVSVPAQSNEPGCETGACDIRSLCAILTADAAQEDHAMHGESARAGQAQRAKGAPSPELALKRLAAVNAAQRNGECTPTAELDPLAALAELLNETSAARAWPYQTCAEFGFFQTCEVGSRCPFARGALPLEPSFEMCRRAFGIGAREVAEHVANTNRRYGGDAPAASRVLFVNGDVGESCARPALRSRPEPHLRAHCVPCSALFLRRRIADPVRRDPLPSHVFAPCPTCHCIRPDPWSALGVLVSPDGNRSEPVFLVSGASHHAWSHPADSIVQPTVRAAKELVWRHVIRWLHSESVDR